MALLVMAAMSEPALGSLQPWAHMSSQRAMRGRKRAFCSGVPNSMNVGPSSRMPFWFTRCGASAAQYSSSKTSHSMRPAPRPPSATGQFSAL